MINLIAITYAVYLLISLGMTVWVARTLHRNGRIFLVRAFGGNADLADAVNHLLVVGFYLVNIGFVALFLRTTGRPGDLGGVIELLSGKIGVVLLVLGGMHFLNVLVFQRMGRGREGVDEPPVRPAAYPDLKGGDVE